MQTQLTDGSQLLCQMFKNFGFVDQYKEKNKK